MSGLRHYMSSLSKYLSPTTCRRNTINTCKCNNHTWESLLTGRPEGFIDQTCCAHHSPKHLIINGKPPKFLSGLASMVLVQIVG
eukprot:447357-Ditylum_brightwellii.AAC.1